MTPEETDASHMNLFGEKVPLGSRRDTFNVDIFSCKCVGASRRGEDRGQCMIASLKEKCDVASHLCWGLRHIVVEIHKELQRTHHDRECPGRSQCGRFQHCYSGRGTLPTNILPTELVS